MKQLGSAVVAGQTLREVVDRSISDELPDKLEAGYVLVVYFTNDDLMRQLVSVAISRSFSFVASMFVAGKGGKPQTCDHCGSVIDTADKRG